MMKQTLTQQWALILSRRSKVEPRGRCSCIFICILTKYILFLFCFFFQVAQGVVHARAIVGAFGLIGKQEIRRGATERPIRFGGFRQHSELIGEGVSN